MDVDEVLATQGVLNKNYSTLLFIRAEVEEVLWDQAGRGQVLVMPDAEAKNRFPNLVVASLGAQKEKPGGVISARLLFDDTNGDFANTSTFGLTADVKEAHRMRGTYLLFHRRIFHRYLDRMGFLAATHLLPHQV